jgi:plasmid stability protein
MKNVTISLDDETHRKARIRAAERGKSLSALVRDLLIEDSGLSPDRSAEEDIRHTLAALRKRVPAGFRASDRLSRDETHERHS